MEKGKLTIRHARSALQHRTHGAIGTASQTSRVGTSFQAIVPPAPLASHLASSKTEPAMLRPRNVKQGTAGMRSEFFVRKMMRFVPRKTKMRKQDASGSDSDDAGGTTSAMANATAGATAFATASATTSATSTEAGTATGGAAITGTSDGDVTGTTTTASTDTTATTTAVIANATPTNGDGDATPGMSKSPSVEVP